MGEGTRGRDEGAGFHDLEARAAAERGRAEEALGARKRRDARRSSKERSARDRGRGRSRRAPTGFGSSLHAFWSGLGVLVLAAVAVALALSGDLLAWAPVQAVAVAVIVAYAAVAWVVVTGWRRRLRYRLEGYDTIRGNDDDMGERDVPWIAFEVRVSLSSDDPETRRAVALALDVLASRANRLLDENEDARIEKDQRWRVEDDLTASGESWKAMFVTGTLRRWLAGEMNRVAASWPAVESIRIDARYTGRSFSISVGTMS